MPRQLVATAALAVTALFCSQAWADGTSTFAEALERGPLYLALASFGFGLLVSLTPCVYPMVAITVSVFGAAQSRGRLQSFALSGAFLAGLVAMFVPLGVVAALTGRTFGSALSSPWIVTALAGFFIALALSMFGAYELDLPAGLKNRLAGAGGAGYFGAFVLGLVCGPIAAPCTGPFLYGLLAWIAQTQSVPLGSAAMAAFALGLGTPFFLVGAFAMQLPKSGAWMLHVKSLMGILLLVVALYFLGNAFPVLHGWVQPGGSFLGVMVGLTVAGLAFGAVHRSFEGGSRAVRLGKGLGIAMVCVSMFGAISSLGTPERTLTWEKPQAAEPLDQFVIRARESAQKRGQPVFLDFTASWCAACKEIETHTFPDQLVQQAAGRFSALKLDMTDDSDPAVERVFKEYAIVGLPTLILLGSDGREQKRFFGDFVEASQLAEAMDAVR